MVLPSAVPTARYHFPVKPTTESTALDFFIFALPREEGLGFGAQQRLISLRDDRRSCTMAVGERSTP
ncbi:hypothetical protein FQA47_000264 [Oryzias melastigma]|uniref:Uncharacterized protein n=1 Tax=Oryzias melastigma TaxID=30732 RepID=A0A834CL59_ORYME|nr:hypothetical protein FQA47_000264 [Oryzias melastigma]